MTVQPVGTTPAVPTIWKREIQVATRKQLIVAQLGVTNRDFEGDISQQGDSVHITGLEPVSVDAYDRINGLGNPERLEVNEKTFTITEADKYDFLVDDIEKVQLPDKTIVPKAVADASYRLAARADSFVTTKMLAGAGNKLIAPGTIDETNAYRSVFIRALRALGNAGAPKAGRWAVIDPIMESILLLDDKRFVANGSEASDDRLLTGQIGSAAGFNILVSTDPKFAGKVVAGVGDAVTYADQIVKNRVMESENWFGTRCNGLHVYGAQVVRPENLVVVSYTAADFDPDADTPVDPEDEGAGA